MLAANEAVARFMIGHRLPFICRVHEAPDPESLKDFQTFVRALGYNLPDPHNVKQIQALLREAEGRGDKHAVNYTLLRSLKQAEYSPVPGLHFALATKHYCHFTSPIRRYPDLIVHRMLDEHFAGRLARPEGREAWQRQMPAWAAHSSFTERRSEDAERELTKLKVMNFMEDRMGEVMNGIISGIREFGIFVQLEDYLIDGLIRLSTMRDDFYRFDRAGTFVVGQRSRRRFRIGDPVKVILASLNFVRREVEFVMGPEKGEKRA
jgi:ribonuclease R